jgi:hypothetical protein
MPRQQNKAPQLITASQSSETLIDNDVSSAPRVSPLSELSRSSADLSSAEKSVSEADSRPFVSGVASVERVLSASEVGVIDPPSLIIRKYHDAILNKGKLCSKC